VSVLTHKAREQSPTFLAVDLSLLACFSLTTGPAERSAEMGQLGGRGEGSEGARVGERRKANAVPLSVLWKECTRAGKLYQKSPTAHSPERVHVLINHPHAVRDVALCRAAVGADNRHRQTFLRTKLAIIVGTR